MEHILKNLKLPEKGKVLDLGCRYGKFSELYPDRDWIGVDKNGDGFPSNAKQGRILFVEQDIRNFKIEPNTYALIIARNVFPFFDSKEEIKVMIEKCMKSLVSGGYFYFTIFGEETEGGGKLKYNPIENEFGKPYFYSFEKGYMPALNGEIKYWEIYSFIIKKV